MKLSELTKQQRKVIRAWCMFDWANSAYATSGIAAILPFYFVYLFKETLGDEFIFVGMTFTGSSMWSLAAALSTAVVALTSPILGVIADRIAIKKTLMAIYTAAGSLFTILMFFSAYSSNPWAWLLGTFILGNIGFAGSLVFYNSLLPHVAPKEMLDDVSSRGFAYGYIGGGVLLLIHLGINIIVSGTDIEDLATRLSIASIGIWWFLWAIWTIKIVPEPIILKPIKEFNPLKVTILAINQLLHTFKELKQFRVMLIYLIAYLIFNDGIQTVMGVAGAFAADTLGIALAFNMMTILIIQFVAAGGSMVFSRIADIITTKNALMVTLVGWSFVVLFGIAIAPLVPDKHKSHDYQFDYDQRSGLYKITANPDLSTSLTDILWASEIGNLAKETSLSINEVNRLLILIPNSVNNKYSASVSGGSLDSQTAIGYLHPSNLGKGLFDWWPLAIRTALWAPLHLAADFQWLIMGVMVGIVMGGSQALARSLFAKISPETPSAEFFSFFGFMSRASTVFGPMLYVIMTSAVDTRTAVLSILILIISGTIIFYWVDVEEGILTAQKEDERFRNNVE
jgi:UMF1 family MFS transporter